MNPKLKLKFFKNVIPVQSQIFLTKYQEPIEWGIFDEVASWQWAALWKTWPKKSNITPLFCNKFQPGDV